MVWKEGTNDYRMIYTGRGSVTGQIGYATSTDGINWTKHPSNPVFNDPTWAHNQTQNWGVMKVGSEYLMWYCNFGVRESGIAVSTDLINWTPHTSSPIFQSSGSSGDDRYSQFSPFSFKYGSYYYVLVPSYNSGANYAKSYLYRSSSPYFPVSDRHLVRIAHTSQPGGVDALDNDTPCLLTLDIERSVFPNNELWLYFGAEPGSGWREGLIIETDIAAALADAPLPFGNLSWSSTGSVVVVNTPVKHDTQSVRFTNTASLTGSFSPLVQGVVGSWMQRTSTSNGDFDFYLYGGSTLSCVAGLGRNGNFHYWNGSFQESTVTWSTNTWYLVTLEFNCTNNLYDFIVYDEDLQEVINVSGISFGNGSSSINKGMLYTSSGYTGTTFADDYRIRKLVTNEPGITLGPEQYLTTAWTGSVDTDWSDTGNWTTDAPGSYSKVTIPSSPVNQPHITAVPSSPVECDDLTIESGAVLTIDAGKALTVNGSLINNTGTSGLVIESSTAGTGSLIHNTDGVIGSFKQYLTADAWHYVSSPINNALSGVFTGIYLKPFDESIDDWGAYITATNIPLNVMQGYSAWVAGTATKVNFEGNLNNGDQSIGVSCRDYNPLVENGGWNLVGNPYPSSIDWDLAGWIKDQVDNTVYFYSGNGGTGNYYYYQGSGGLPGIGTSTMSSIIPAKQGFFVHVIDDGIPGVVNGTLGVSNSVRIHSDQAYYKKSGKNEIPMIRLQASNSGNLTDEAIIRFYSGATSEHDGAYDAYKLDGYMVPQLYSITPEESNLAINTLPVYDNETIIPLGFTSPEVDEYSITLSEFENFEPLTTLYLEDQLNEVMHNLTIDPDYVFTSTPGDEPNRFLLHFTENLLAINSIDQTSVIIYSFNKTVYVHLPENTEKAVVKIYNMMGQEVANKFIYDGLNKISLDNNAYYVVKVMYDGGVATKKVFVR